MDNITYDSEIFTDLNYADKKINGREFQSCTFKKCDFAGADLSNNKFLECVFDGCNLSMAKFGRSTLNDVAFKNCKILGVNFHECLDFLFDVRFESSIVDYASFMGKKMLKTKFTSSSLKETNFSQCNLAGSVFSDCNLEGTIFNRTDLSSANFSTAYNFNIDPELNNMKRAIFSTHGLPGLLGKHQLKIV